MREPRLVLALLLAVLSCTGDPQTNNGDPDPALNPGNGAGGSTPIEPTPGNREGCPLGEPRPGENCPDQFGDGARCTFTVGMCFVSGRTVDLHQDYCCFNGLWDRCETENPECDPPDAMEPVDAPVVADAGAPHAPAPEVDAGAGQDAAPAGNDAAAGDDAVAIDAPVIEDAAAPDTEAPDVATGDDAVD